SWSFGGVYSAYVFLKAQLGIGMTLSGTIFNLNRIMKKSCSIGSCSRILPLIAILCCSLPCSQAQQESAAELRAPATPLIAHDPYFSVWSNANRLTGGPTRHWTGKEQRLNGIFQIAGNTFRYRGDGDDEIPALEETML